MILVPDVTLKSPTQVEPGELLAIELRSHRALGIVLSKEQNRSLIGLVETLEEGLKPNYPFAFHFDRQHGGGKECVSFGQDWVLELLPGRESVPGNRADWATPGVVYLSSAGPTIFFPGLNSPFGDGYTFNLETRELVEAHDQGVPHLHWRIWASQSDRDHPARLPLVTFAGKNANM